nr:hypothetical protein [Desulfobulbaceae bacterium]
MQIDMHYYGVYALARAAGMKPEFAEIVATASQFVDDNEKKGNLEFCDGGRLDFEATAHHYIDFKNVDKEDQRQIWVPFHFLPGGIDDDDYADRLICRIGDENNAVVTALKSYVLADLHEKFSLSLVGSFAHIYADTFSHYGFCGISDPVNQVKNDEFVFYNIHDGHKRTLLDKIKAFRARYPKEGGALQVFKSFFAENITGALGHGAVLVYPDLPYLSWSFIYDADGRFSGVRDNQKTFLLGCRALYDFFREVLSANPDFSIGTTREFADIEDRVKRILTVRGDKVVRAQAWKQAAAAQQLYDGLGGIPDYDRDFWVDRRERLIDTDDSKHVASMPIYRFYQAVAVLRNTILRKVLPAFGLIVA